MTSIAIIPQKIKVNGELDGINNSGAIGNLLNAGTENLSADSANAQFSLSENKVSGLLAEDNQAIGTAAQIIDAGERDDMYVAGDPGVGGKGNNYEYLAIDPMGGFITMLEDGLDNGRKITINSHVEDINAQGNEAYTEYGFVIQDDAGTKTTATLSGGQLNITDADGNTKTLLPGETFTIGDAADPVARFFYEDVPGGENSNLEKRVVFEYIEKPTQEVIDQLVHGQGVNRAEAENLRTTNRSTFGFRIPDGNGSFRQSAGVGGGQTMKETANGVKTYYDAHFHEGECYQLDGYKPVDPYPPIDPPTEPPINPPVDPPTYPPVEPPVYPPSDDPVAPNEKARAFGDPHIKGADGGRYNFHEVGIYNLLQDSGISVNSSMKKMNSRRKATFIKETGLQLGNQQLHITDNGKILLDGQELPLGKKLHTLNDGSTVGISARNSKARKVNIETAEYKIRVHIHPNRQDVDIVSKKEGVMTDGVAPGGILGETFDADKDKVKGFKQNSANDYARESLFTPVFLPSPTPTPDPVPVPSPDPNPVPADPFAQVLDLINGGRFQEALAILIQMLTAQTA